MKIDLSTKLPKVWHESERSVRPEETIARVEKAARRLGMDVSMTAFCHGGVFWTTRMNTDFKARMPAGGVRTFRLGGKGPSELQARASCAMEFVERWSLYKTLAARPRDYECVDLRTGERLRIGPFADLRDTKCLSAGNNYEEAILHSLHELVETRLGRSCLFKPLKVVDLDRLFPELPAWVKDAFVVFKTPADGDAFHHFTAVKYPANGDFDDDRRDRILKLDDRLVFAPATGMERHSPNSGGAAGLNPRLTAFRAMNEAFQGDFVDATRGGRRPLPPHVPVAEESELQNLETESITDDIRLILERLGPQTFVGVIDVTDPALGIPVIKLVSDYDPHASLASRRILEQFFRF